MALLYLQPPSGVVSYQKLEDFGLNRLRFLARLVACKDESERTEAVLDAETVNWSDCLIAGSAKDKISHYVLRLALAHDADNAQFLCDAETILFRMRLDSFSVQDWLSFFKSLKKQFGQYHYGILKNFCVFFNILCEDFPHWPSLAEGIRNTADPNWSTCVHLPFQLVLGLVAQRRVVLKQGLASVPLNMLPDVLEQLFRDLMGKMVQQHICQQDPMRRQADSRMSRLSAVLRRAYHKEVDPTPDIPFGSQRLTLDCMTSSQTCFPLCMSQLLATLDKHHRLCHRDRIQLTLFLKELGLPVHQALLFWKREYSKPAVARLNGTGTSTSCGHDWRGNERRYIYNIRHLYGLEGKRASYSAHSCASIQGRQLSCLDSGGCPFTSLDTSALTSLLSQQGIAGSDIEDIVHGVDAGSVGRACRLATFHRRKSLKVTPSDNENVTSSDNEEVAPSDNEKVAPSDNEKVAPSDNEKVAPSDNEEVAPSDNEKVAPSDNEKVAPSDNEKVTPNDYNTKSECLFCLFPDTTDIDTTKNDSCKSSKISTIDAMKNYSCESSKSKISTSWSGMNSQYTDSPGSNVFDDDDDDDDTFFVTQSRRFVTIERNCDDDSSCEHRYKIQPSASSDTGNVNVISGKDKTIVESESSSVESGVRSRYVCNGKRGAWCVYRQKRLNHGTKGHSPKRVKKSKVSCSHLEDDSKGSNGDDSPIRAVNGYHADNLMEKNEIETDRLRYYNRQTEIGGAGVKSVSDVVRNCCQDQLLCAGGGNSCCCECGGETKMETLVDGEIHQKPRIQNYLGSEQQQCCNGYSVSNLMWESEVEIDRRTDCCCHSKSKRDGAKNGATYHQSKKILCLQCGLARKIKNSLKEQYSSHCVKCDGESSSTSNFQNKLNKCGGVGDQLLRKPSSVYWDVKWVADSDR